MKNLKAVLLAFGLLLSSVIFPLAHAAASSPAIPESSYPFVAALARASILADAPVTPNSLKIVYLFENGVALESQAMIKEGVDNFVSHFGNIMAYTSGPVGVIAYNTLEGGLTLTKSWDPKDSVFVEASEQNFATKPDPKKEQCQRMGGFSVEYKRLVVIGAPCFTDPKFALSDPTVATHELAHEVQKSINKGRSMRYPLWLIEGGASVIGGVMSVYQGEDYWPNGGRDQWSKNIPGNRTIADLVAMEGETTSLTDPELFRSEYTVGAAVAEYLIAKGGFANSLLVQQYSKKTLNPSVIAGFREAFRVVYGQSLDDFYLEALPYVNYVSANSTTTLPTSSEAVAFITARLGQLRAAATAAAELKAKQIANKAALAKKMISITCVKGKLIKKVTARKPVCPRGYKKK